jgi:hypothetical protein
MKHPWRIYIHTHTHFYHIRAHAKSTRPREYKEQEIVALASVCVGIRDGVLFCYFPNCFGLLPNQSLPLLLDSITKTHTATSFSLFPLLDLCTFNYTCSPVIRARTPGALLVQQCPTPYKQGTFPPNSWPGIFIQTAARQSHRRTTLSLDRLSQTSYTKNKLSKLGRQGRGCARCKVHGEPTSSAWVVEDAESGARKAPKVRNRGVFD